MVKNWGLSLWLLQIILLFSINTAHSQNALVVEKNVGATASSALANIQRITFSDDNLQIKPFEGNVSVYAFDKIAKITFEDVIILDITNPPATNLVHVVVYSTSQGEIIIESSVDIQRIALFNTDGKILYVGKQINIDISTFPTGIYILQIETIRGTIAKKIIKQNK